MLVNMPPLVRGVVAVTPPLLALMVAYARYDGFFRDQTIFLYYMGGLGLGLVVAFLDLTVIYASPLLFIAGAPLLSQMAKAVAVNLPRWQGKPHAVFNGGACGAGVGTMLVLAYGQIVIPDTGSLLRPALTLLALGGGISLVHVATGALVGLGVAEGRVLPRLATAVAATIPVTVFVFEALQGARQASVLHPLWALLALAYGAIALWVAMRRVLPHGLTMENRRELRRRTRNQLS